MAGGVLLTIAGAWVLAQVLRGGALIRLGIVAGDDQPAADSGTKIMAPGPTVGVPVPKAYLQ